MATTAKLWTINDIKAANRAAGFHWFDPDTMRFFGTRILPTVYQGPGGVYFVTWDKKGFDERQGYGATVRTFDPETGSTGTAKEGGDIGSISSKSKAGRIAANLAQGPTGRPSECAETSEDYKPVSVLDQFVFDLEKHATPTAGPLRGAADALMSRAKRHHRFMERLCGDEAFCRGVDAEGNHPDVTRCRGAISKLAEEVGCKGVIFSGDPRGCTVKLTFADGFTNDFGGEGYCVPTEE